MPAPVPYIMPVRNVSGEAIPPFAVMQITGLSTDGYYLVNKPDADALVTGLLFNGPGAIPITGNGDGHFQFPGIAQFDAGAGAIPAHGDTWGTKASSWYLWKDNAGFRAVGAGTTISGTNGYFNVMDDASSAAGGSVPFWIKITDQEASSGSPTGAYSWVEQEEDAAGSWVNKPGGRSSLYSGAMPGYEASLSLSLVIGTIVLAKEADDGNSVRFDHPVDTGFGGSYSDLGGSFGTEDDGIRKTDNETYDQYRPFSTSPVLLASGVSCALVDTLAPGRSLSGSNLIWTGYMDIDTTEDVRDACTRSVGSNSLLYSNGDRIVISGSVYVVVWVAIFDQGGAGEFKRVYMMRHTY